MFSLKKNIHFFYIFITGIFINLFGSLGSLKYLNSSSFSSTFCFLSSFIFYDFSLIVCFTSSNCYVIVSFIIYNFCKNSSFCAYIVFPLRGPLILYYLYFPCLFILYSYPSFGGKSFSSFLRSTEFSISSSDIFLFYKKNSITILERLSFAYSKK